jgi:uncharacterized RDD family membrane protein YckC
VGGEVVALDTTKIPMLNGAIPWITQGLLLGRPLPFVSWAWAIAGVFLLINLLLLMLFPRPLQACVDTIERQPVASLFAGILFKLLLGLVTVLLFVSVVGLIVVPFLLAGSAVAFLFGKITIYRYVGRQLGRQAHLAALEAPAVALIIGTLVIYLLYAVPFLGFLAWAFTGYFGLGAVGMTIIQTFRSERAKSAAVGASIPATTIQPATSNPPGEASASSAAVSAASGPAMAATAPLESALWPRAGFWIRTFALAIDFIVVIIPFVFFRIKPPLPFLGVLVYHIALWTWKGTTVGGIVMGIKLVRVDGRPLDFAVCLIRGLAGILSLMVLGLGFFWAGFSRDKQSWHDKIAGTVMVKVPHGISLI